MFKENLSENYETPQVEIMEIELEGAIATTSGEDWFNKDHEI